jgi:uncharacterized protein (DUF2252 family)
MARLARASILDVWYYHVEADTVLELFDQYAKKASKRTRKMVEKAQTRTQRRTLEKITEVVDGRRRIVNDPPLLVRLSDAVSKEDTGKITQAYVEDTWAQYLASLPVERRRLLERFRMTDAALRVGGVGSVGTRCAITLLEGEDDQDAIILQQKESGPSALGPYLAKHDYPSQAQRVVHGQRLMQAASDIFLGWHTSSLTKSEYYWRQLKDMKGSVDVSLLDEYGLGTYLAVCSICLARAHARSGDAAAISGYLGQGKAFEEAIADFATAYADQTERDYQALVDAVKSGCIAAETGI